MPNKHRIKINFRGGIISPGELLEILEIVDSVYVSAVRFGLRQQLLFEAETEYLHRLKQALTKLNVLFEIDNDHYPNVVSSYPAQDVFIKNGWLSEGVYKDIFAALPASPALKLNISDSLQSFTPMLTGNINWIASREHAHFWHLLIRFPKTNVICEWDQLVYTNDIARISRAIEALILSQADQFVDNPQVDGQKLFKQLDSTEYNTRRSTGTAELSPFNLPYYEGLNRYEHHFWLGIYRRDELFQVDFLKALCSLCLSCKIAQIGSTPWKSIVVKSIEEKDLERWNSLLADYRINMRHAANELNFQVEDNCPDALKLKKRLVKAFNDNDIRSFGLCVGIKMRRKNEIFSSILIRRRPLFRFLPNNYLARYDILCAENFNPNERTGFIFKRGISVWQLPKVLASCFQAYYSRQKTVRTEKEPAKSTIANDTTEIIFQCRECKTVSELTENELFKDNLPEDYRCSLCEAPASSFEKVSKESLGLFTV